MKNRNSGERFLWQTTAQTLGRSISFELEIPPGGAVPGAHRHPCAVERFKVLTRQITLRVEGRGGSTQELALEVRCLGRSRWPWHAQTSTDRCRTTPAAAAAAWLVKGTA